MMLFMINWVKIGWSSTAWPGWDGGEQMVLREMVKRISLSLIQSMEFCF